jgi:hypothetical protein
MKRNLWPSTVTISGDISCSDIPLPDQTKQKNARKMSLHHFSFGIRVQNHSKIRGWACWVEQYCKRWTSLKNIVAVITPP